MTEQTAEEAARDVTLAPLTLPDMKAQDLIDIVITIAPREGWCSEAALALGYVFSGDPENVVRSAAYELGLSLYHSKTGLNVVGRDRDGYDKNGYDRDGRHRDGERIHPEWCETCGYAHD